uniref:Uncharacterized protein n=1 Tax=Aureoumbra lagunensis TaxID=44058 RepID=A0A7S3NPP3_9STRA
MNAGKSTLMNRITRQETSIVDQTPGTTADTKIALMELHEIGPCKIFDTAGIDEKGELGDKKRLKTFSNLKECDLAILVVDSFTNNLDWECILCKKAAEYGILPLLVYNVKSNTAQQVAEQVGAHAEKVQNYLVQGLEDCAAKNKNYDPAEFRQLPLLVTDLDDQNVAMHLVIHFLQQNAKRVKAFMPCALPQKYLSSNAAIFLNIPMDAETPSMRLLRPQALVQEEAIRHWATTISYRMDLAAARGNDSSAKEKERLRFRKALDTTLAAADQDAPKIMITDSQALDIVHPWTLDDNGQPLIDITTFSICMMHRQSGAQLPLFAQGMQAYTALAQPKSTPPRILMAEACNHNRITDICNDIGLVQIPEMINKHITTQKPQIDHTFGREFPNLEQGLNSYDLIIHCGACMIDHQKVRARISDAAEAKVPITNYGLLMAYAYHGPDALYRVLDPWQHEHA